MAKIFDLNITDATSIDDFAYAANSINLDSEDEISSLAPKLKALSNNKEWLQEFISEGLLNPTGFQQDNLYSSQSCILRTIGERSFLRFAVWAPKTFGEQLDEDNFFSYSTAHNHDFSLLTAGYLGPGYETSIYKINNFENVIGYPGEHVDIEFTERFRLEPGRVVLYEAGTDIHVQHEPSSISVSLNLIVAQPQMNIRQLYFDTRAKRIGGYVGNSTLKRGIFFRFAAAMPSKENYDMLLAITNSHPCELTRIYAYRALAQSYQELPTVEDMMRHDSSQLVRSSVQLLKNGLQTLHVWG